MANVLVACEFSATVRDAFRARGHDAWSCDIEPTEGDPAYHIQGDVLLYLHHPWDLMVAFPPCTYLTNSNAFRWAAIEHQRAESLDFVWALMSCGIPRIAIENPVGAIGTEIRPADQYVQPWMFGDPYQKRTGLWLDGLPLLVPEVTVKPPEVRPWIYGRATRKGPYVGVHSGGKKASKAAHRARNLTFPGIARAMAAQWG